MRILFCVAIGILLLLWVKYLLIGVCQWNRIFHPHRIEGEGGC